jgi:hypothetical protein
LSPFLCEFANSQFAPFGADFIEEFIDENFEEWENFSFLGKFVVFLGKF